MDFYWIYDISTWTSFIIIVGLTVAISIGEIFLLKPFVQKNWSGHDNNDQIAFYLSAVGVFYGITLGLLAAGVWGNYNEADEKVNSEASALAALYRDVSSFPEAESKLLRQELKDYCTYVITIAWPLHQKGIAKTEGTQLLNVFQKNLYSYNPQSKREEIILSEAIRQFNRLVELRRQRLQSVGDGMITVVWFMILIGALITITICCLFNIPSIHLHITMNCIIALVIGSLIHLIVMLDNPFRGEVSIGSESYQSIHDDLMSRP